MKILLTGVLSTLFLWSCQDQSLNVTSDKAAQKQLEAKHTRPQESGEGLPGYLYCQSEDDEEYSSIDCRLEQADQKMDLSEKDQTWSLTFPQRDIRMVKNLLPDDEPWHVNFMLFGDRDARQRAITSASIGLTYDGYVRQNSLPKVLDSGIEVEGGDEATEPESEDEANDRLAPFQLLFGPAASQVANGWMGLNLTGQTNTTLSTNMGSAIGNVQIDIVPQGGRLLIPEGTIPESGNGVWRTLSATGISSAGTMTLNGQLPAGAYRLTLYLGSLFTDQDAGITLTSPGNDPMTTTLAAGRNTEASDASFVVYESTHTGSFSIQIQSAEKVVLHGMTLEPL
ncbi:hypothetical protein [Pseudobacteriovorax antillogorgiicola]|uniref:Uncharacterized protein n=1 Tax=Pseudobacteriovorax antillogorgiicola TaxID=1513793 RepID=A0A1Y6BGA3_9BACT|nr:hypothetical protein [Pseudobacteriovorax antillogorgiicola]TCS57375.1 hypothetical protein EDD56_103115 [Pseudobacteriovorax antillogorgiicola]SMF01874.1 hypothetical protein SAMN06296036_103218 [Pseudobacteriovorax antillogorgiicola]